MFSKKVAQRRTKISVEIDLSLYTPKAMSVIILEIKENSERLNTIDLFYDTN